MAKKIPPSGWRPDRGEGNSKHFNYTTLWPCLQAIDTILPPCPAQADTILQEVVAWT